MQDYRNRIGVNHHFSAIDYLFVLLRICGARKGDREKQGNKQAEVDSKHRDLSKQMKSHHCTRLATNRKPPGTGKNPQSPVNHEGGSATGRPANQSRGNGKSSHI
jgi:hypothetical protein